MSSQKLVMKRRWLLAPADLLCQHAWHSAKPTLQALQNRIDCATLCSQQNWLSAMSHKISKRGPQEGAMQRRHFVVVGFIHPQIGGQGGARLQHLFCPYSLKHAETSACPRNLNLSCKCLPQSLIMHALSHTTPCKLKQDPLSLTACASSGDPMHTSQPSLVSTASRSSAIVRKPLHEFS